MTFVINIFLEAWHLLLESSLYVIFGLLFSGLLRVFLNPSAVSRQLGKGKFKSVFKAAFLGIPFNAVQKALKSSEHHVEQTT